MDYFMRPYRYGLFHGVCIMGTVSRSMPDGVCIMGTVSWSMPDGVCLMVLYLMSFISDRVIICYMTFNIDNDRSVNKVQP